MYSTQVYCAKGETIATCAWYPRPIDDRGAIGTYRHENACLIAAAPEGFDLIAALEESFTADGTYQQFLPAMRAYLLKAKGEPS